MDRLKIYISSLFKVAVAALFIVSALLKMSSIDSFELYIFSFDLFSLNMSALLARAVIGAEIVMGVGYLSNLYHKQFYYSILASLLLFTLFLLYLTLVGRDDNCHCFGDLVDISPLHSILKNVAIMAMLYLSRGVPAWSFNFEITLSSAILERYRVYIFLTICALIIIPFVRYPSHKLYNIVNSRGDDYVAQRVNVELFNQFIEDNADIGWGEQTKIIAFYGTKCKYCSSSSQQLSQIIRRNSLDIDAMMVAFWGSDSDVEEFFESSNAVDFNYRLIDPKSLLDITNGKIPTIILYDPESEYNISIPNMRSIQESEIVELMGKIE